MALSSDQARHHSLLRLLLARSVTGKTNVIIIKSCWQILPSCASLLSCVKHNLKQNFSCTSRFRIELITKAIINWRSMATSHYPPEHRHGSSAKSAAWKLN